MTEAGKKWAAQVSKLKDTPNWSIDYRWQAEFWVRAFCDEVEKKAAEIRHDHNNLVADGLAFREFKAQAAGGEMTEAGEKWVEEQGRSGLYKSAANEAEFWIRAFCNEVEKRALGKGVDPRMQTPFYLRSVRVEAFDELTRELLGETK